MTRIGLLLAALCISTPAFGQNCGGSFPSFVNTLKSEALSKGYSAKMVNAFFANAQQDPAVIKADRAQGFFQRPFLDFSSRLISKHRIDHGAKNLQKYATVFDRIEREYGISRGVLTAFWAFETDFGAFQGDFNTLNALLTLSHDCRRPDLFRPQVFAALELYKRGDFDPMTTTGAWAGEIGMVQMLPGDILESGIDGDGDGHVTLKTSAADALMTGAHMLSRMGWRTGEPWLHEIIVPQDLDWSQTGLDQTKSVAAWKRLGVTARTGALGPDTLDASVLLPQGRKGPAFLAYPNFHIYFEWNKSFVYVTTAAYFATRLEGAPPNAAGNPDPALSGDEMKQLQTKLTQLGYDVGAIDGILGAKTRSAVQAVQIKLGLPADAWPTQSLLDQL
jgi:lytic murein transglycosylase